MGLLRTTRVNTDCLMGLWHITEDYDTLSRLVALDDDDLRWIGHFKNEARKVELLSVRALLQTMTTPEARIVYNEMRKPFLVDGSQNISISHSNRYTSILLSSTQRVGIDLEYMSHRIERVASKFIAPSEYITPRKGMKRIHLYIHWFAKEAMYKICDKQELNFQEHILVEPFEVSSSGSGYVTGTVSKRDRQEQFSLHYELLNNYVIVYTSKPGQLPSPLTGTTALAE